jgi:glycerophosphoryl diester phosphodiesterase
MMVLLFFAGLFYLFAHRNFWRNSSEVFVDGPGFELISHRGIKSVAPENTIEAFLAAVDLGFNWVEVDVMATSDRAIVCSHNFDLERETDQFGYVHHRSLKDIKNAYTGVNKDYVGAYRIPELKIILEKVPNHIGINIEIKSGSLFDLSTARALISLKNVLLKRPVIISSFNPLVLAYLHVFLRAAPTGFLLESKKYLWITNWLHPDYLHLRGDMVTESIISLCKKRNMRINAWTVNNKSAIKALFNKQIVGVVTDMGAVL